MDGMRIRGKIDTILTNMADWDECYDLLKPGGYLLYFGKGY